MLDSVRATRRHAQSCQQVRQLPIGIIHDDSFIPYDVCVHGAQYDSQCVEATPATLRVADRGGDRDRLLVELT